MEGEVLANERLAPLQLSVEPLQGVCKLLTESRQLSLQWRRASFCPRG